MEVDGGLTGAGPSGPISPSGNFAILPRIDENAAVSPLPTKDRFISILDQVEMLVERFRKDAARLEEERDSLLGTLDTLRNSYTLYELDEYEKDEVHRYCERITTRCYTVEVLVRTHRDAAQEEALHQVNALIDCLVLEAQSDWNASRCRCEAFQNACTSLPTGPTDKAFEIAVLGCTLDDQKKIKKRLQGLMDYFDKKHIQPL